MNLHLQPTSNQVFTFGDTSHEIRFFTDNNNDIWAVAKDIATVLNIKNIRQHFKNMPDEWSYVYKTDGLVNYTLLKEPAIYRLIMRSNKPQALNFQRWVCEDILPSIRKSGSYTMQQNKQLELVESQKDTCNMLMKYFPKDSIVQHKVKEYLINNLAITNKPISTSNTTNVTSNTHETNTETIFYDITTILRKLNYPTWKKQTTALTGVGKYVAKKYRNHFNKNPQHTTRIIQGASRQCKCYTQNEVDKVKQWVTDYFTNKKPNFWK